jgi:hypothetical protein
MSGGDRTGPVGRGPMTGHTVGYCAGFGMPGYANPVPGGGFGMGFGCGRGFRGRGWRHWFYATGLPSPLVSKCVLDFCHPRAVYGVGCLGSSARRSVGGRAHTLLPTRNPARLS